MRTVAIALWRNSGNTGASGLLGWIGRKPAAVALVAVIFAYFAYPYVALYRLGNALSRGDMGYVVSHMDWNSVRAGIAADVASSMTGEDPVAPAAAAAPDDLPAFGASFATHLATNAVDEYLTADVFAASLSKGSAVASGPATVVGGPDAAHLRWAFFSAPTHFTAYLTTRDGAPVRLRMELIGTSWILTRAWLPMGMLTASQR